MSIKDLHEDLKAKRKAARSELSWDEFHAAVIDYQPSKKDNHWTIHMKAYRADGTWFGSQYDMASCSPELTIDDFRVHYNARVHWAWFHRRTHFEYAIVIVDRKFDPSPTPILVFKAFGERFSQFRSLLKDVVAMHQPVARQERVLNDWPPGPDESSESESE